MRNKELETISFTRHTKTFEILLQPSFCKISPEFQHDISFQYLKLISQEFLYYPKSKSLIFYLIMYVNYKIRTMNVQINEKSPKRRELGGNTNY